MRRGSWLVWEPVALDAFNPPSTTRGFSFPCSVVHARCYSICFNLCYKSEVHNLFGPSTEHFLLLLAMFPLSCACVRMLSGREISAHKKTWSEHKFPFITGFLCIFHSCRSKYRRVLVKCCTQEMLCAQNCTQTKKLDVKSTWGQKIWYICRYDLNFRKSSIKTEFFKV